MSDATTAAVILILSVGVVISYPSLMYPPLRTAAGRALWVLSWPLRAVWRVFQWIGSAPAERGRLGLEVRELVQYAEGKARELAEATGRMWLETQLYIHKPQHAIRDADRTHEELTARFHGLVARSFGQPVWEDEWFREHEAAFRRPPLERWWAIDLWGSWAVWKILTAIFVVTYALPRKLPSYRVRSRRGLRKLREEWLGLLEEQASLLDLMIKLPERTKVYDRLESAKELKRQQRETEDVLLRPLKSAEVALQSAKAHIRVLQIRPQHTPTKGSAVLSLQQAIREWQAKVEVIEQARAEQARPEELIEAIHSLERDMAQAGIYAAKVIWLERRAQQIFGVHKRLKKRYPGLRLPDAELEAITTVIRKAIPPLWAAGQWDELVRILERALVSIQTYERLVLSCVWQLHAGSFEQLVQRVFRPDSANGDTQIRFNPEAVETMKQAAVGSSTVSPYVRRVLEEAQKSNSRLAQRS